ncbi:MAG: DUF4395 domain-containing protein [Sulfuricurvum sp.]|uniref:DUF4395 domain-containing protein n=1 Tax=Sulfuricurvum sp. TaxID=2025608 RepID=UPI002715B112|nr:DUF4395 domain-containing protein [Sulfuricurvum sp.]MDO9056055.1 DUF4395 domain-containing protein [Sulfuricurvum sp.]MDP2850455.1 DUF4395 domain-containing protein [Sulfuricurvum sp.]MDP3290654.1 DUF4395 domain-containing protein [Sulfuricurvum sp.]
MAQQCPLIFRQIDATVVRINTLFVISAISAFLVTHNWVILILLVIDFILRLYGYKHLSPIQNMSLFIQRKLSFPVKMEDAGAKRLAAFFGVGFTVALLIAYWLNADSAVLIIGGIFLFCASMELFFGYCVGCKIYYIAKKLYPKGFE